MPDTSPLFCNSPRDTKNSEASPSSYVSPNKKHFFFRFLKGFLWLLFKSFTLILIYKMCTLAYIWRGHMWPDNLWKGEKHLGKEKYRELAGPYVKRAWKLGLGSYTSTAVSLGIGSPPPAAMFPACPPPSS